MSRTLRSDEPISDMDMFGIFDELDKDHSQTVTWHELREGLLERGVPYGVIKVLPLLLFTIIYVKPLYWTGMSNIPNINYF